MARLMITFILIVLLNACDKVEQEQRFEGKYIGYFHSGGQDTTLVSFMFDGRAVNRFTQESTLPSIWQGYFRHSENKIFFMDSTMWQLQQSLSPIANNTFQYRFEQDGVLRLWRKNGNATDEYILSKMHY